MKLSQLKLREEILRCIHETTAESLRNGDWQRYEGASARKLTELLSERVRRTHCQLMSSGTAALEVLLRAAAIGVNDEVILSSYDYPGNFWAIERVGARPVLVDTERIGWRVSQASLDEVYEPTCKAIVVSHLHGQIQRVDALRQWCDERKLLLIEDVCQSLGASWHGQPLGSYGHAAVFSFGGGKLMSCGRGGAWVTSDELLAVKARVAAGAGSGPYAMSELQAAVVCAQWPFLDQVNAASRVFFGALNQSLERESETWKFPAHDSLAEAAFYQCGWFVDGINIETRDALIEALRGPTTLELAGEQLTLPFGSGFPGFHRRTQRRCRRPESLANAITATAQTIVLHHSVAVELALDVANTIHWIEKQKHLVQKT